MVEIFDFLKCRIMIFTSDLIQMHASRTGTRAAHQRVAPRWKVGVHCAELAMAGVEQ